MKNDIFLRGWMDTLTFLTTSHWTNFFKNFLQPKKNYIHSQNLDKWGVGYKIDLVFLLLIYINFLYNNSSEVKVEKTSHMRITI